MIYLKKAAAARAVLLVSLLASSALAEYTMEDFQTKLFWLRPEQGYAPINVGLQDPQSEGMRIMAISDLNNDKNNDLVTVNANADKVTSWYFDDEEMSYSTSASFNLPSGLKADSIIITKTQTELQNMIVTASTSDPNASTKQTKMLHYLQKRSTSLYTWEQITDSVLTDTLLYPNTQPMILDINADQVMDVLFQSESQGIKVALGSPELSEAVQDPGIFTIANFADFVMTPAEDSNCKQHDSSDKISIPNSNAFIDFNGDCMADIFLTRENGGSSYYEIYAAVKGKDASGKTAQKFCLAAQKGQIVADGGAMPLIEITDVNRDGMLDIAFMTTAGEVTVLYNKYEAPGPKEDNLCGSTGQTGDLASKDFFSPFPFSDGGDVLLQTPLASSYPAGKPVLDGLKESMPGVPGRLRFADLNSDGYPDAVLTLQFSSQDGAQKQTVTTVWMNGEGNSTAGAGDRELLRGPTAAEYYAKISSEAGPTGELVAFVDVDEDGRLDIIVQNIDKNGVPQLVVLYNNIVTDNFFIKALFVNSKQTKSQNIFGNNAIGATYRFVVTNMDDHKLVAVGSQDYQQGYNSLQMPYSFIGIGRSNNYIESFYASTSVEGKRALRMWTPIIPNSQMVVFGKGDTVEAWGLELFISPTNSLYLIVFTCAISLLAIGIAIITLHCQEKQEDKRNIEKHFDFF